MPEDQSLTTPAAEVATPSPSARSSEEYYAIKSEIAKLSALTPSPVDWSVVVDRATDILENQSKDLLVSSYLCVAQIHEDGIGGLAEALTVMRDLVRDSWATLFPAPTPPRGRETALAWLVKSGKAALALDGVKGGVADIAQCVKLIKEIHALLVPHLGNERPLQNLLEPLNELAKKVAGPPTIVPRSERPVVAPQTGALKAASLTAESGSASGVQAPASLTSVDDVAKALRIVRQTVFTSARLLREAKVADHMAYHLPRAVAFGQVAALPPATDGKTSVPAPAPDQRTRLKTLLAAENYRALVLFSEERFATAVLWLDLNRYTATALEGLGHSSAAGAVRGELAIFLRRLGGVEQLCFQNGDPLADQDTKNWIDASVLTGGGGAGAATAEIAITPSEGVPTGTDLIGVPDGFEDAKNEAWSLARTGDPSAALASLATGIYGAGLLRDRAVWRLERARICMSTHQFDAALSQLQILDAELAESTFDDWDPGLTSEIIQSLFHCRQKVFGTESKASPSELEHQRRLLDRLTRVDAAAALALNVQDII